MILATCLLLIGLAFVLAEVFFPSLGLFGIIATGAILFADVLAFEQGDAWGGSSSVQRSCWSPWSS